MLHDSRHVEPPGEEIDRLKLDRLLDRLGDLPNVITGAAAALLQGAPLPIDAPELAIRWRDSAHLTRCLETAYAQRWSEFDELPATVEVRHGGRSYQVVPLVELDVTDPRTATLLRRYREGHLRRT